MTDRFMVEDLVDIIVKHTGKLELRMPGVPDIPIDKQTFIAQLRQAPQDMETPFQAGVDHETNLLILTLSNRGPDGRVW